MSAPFTPGPYRTDTMFMTAANWRDLRPDDGKFTIVRRGTGVLAAVWSPDGMEDEPQARLFAAAPEMYDALVEARSHLTGDPDMPRSAAYTEIDDFVARIDALLARVKGDAP